MEEAKNRLPIAVQELNKLQTEIKMLKDFLRSHEGSYQLLSSKQIIARNKEIYRLRTSGLTFAAIAKQMNLSTSRVTSIFREIDYSLRFKKKGMKFETYKGLLKKA